MSYSKVRPGPTACDAAYHDSIASTPLLWEREALPAPGREDYPVLDSGDRFLQVGRCRICGAKILRAVELDLAPR